jgi:hypothetical protein
MRLELTQAFAHYHLKVACIPISPLVQYFRKKMRNFSLRILRAKNGTRTRDPNLGKVMLYQLSYFRKYGAKIHAKLDFSKFAKEKNTH